MQPLNIVWQSGPVPEGGTRVFEVEHLFGFDVVLCVQQDIPMPLRHSTSTRRMTAAERKIAVAAACWRDSDRYDLSASLWSELTRRLAE